MKRKLTRKSLDELALIIPVLIENDQRRCGGGGGRSAYRNNHDYTIWRR
ncbi:MAG: hypothetical protein GXZ03_00105 [Proteiniphilum sp.]|nr:hypothetical protein [Proteiniphilum sp.]